jgi:hypothetical protein
MVWVLTCVAKGPWWLAPGISYGALIPSFHLSISLSIRPAEASYELLSSPPQASNLAVCKQFGQCQLPLTTPCLGFCASLWLPSLPCPLFRCPLCICDRNTSKARYLLTTLPPSDQDSCQYAHYFSSGSEVRSGAQPSLTPPALFAPQAYISTLCQLPYMLSL